ncbi:hypothetical protein Moror_17852 [Moniliophthora roreri MCA 2997]|uniref:BTB domain-containing protein n=2 Tax=Moniliophthora roreri TaxID=221103 RepID=V2XU42_MONRO|nr:hypothetical protein Moror_17852 [Moniliophthora roreri MCA 2997]
MADITLPPEDAPAPPPETPASSPPPPAPQRHDQLFLDFIVYRVDNTLFKLPSRYFHENSEVLAGASEISTTTGEGLSEDQPIDLPLPHDSDGDDFAELAKVIYALTIGLDPPSLSRHQWVSVLKLSTPWMFSDIRELAISRIHSSNPTFEEKVTLGRRYNVRSWVAEGLKGLSDTSNDLPPLQNLEALGSTTAMRLLYIRNFRTTRNVQQRSCGQVREDIERYGSYCSGCGSYADYHPCRADFLSVEDLFSDELA